MRKAYICIRHELLDRVCHIRNRLDTVIDIVNLPAPRQFTVNRLANHFFIVFTDKGLDGLAILRCFLEHTHIPDSNQAHMHGTRNRCRRQCQNIHIFLQLFDFFFMRHAEPLLLIDIQKAKIFELYVLRQNAVCSDDNIHESFFQILQRFFLLCRRAEPAQKINAHRKVLHALNERIVMLLCQNGGRNEVDDLFALLYCLERCTDCNLGFAVSDIAADQAVHNLFALHVRLCRLNRRKLIVRLLKRKQFLKFLLPDRILSELIAG